MIYEMRIKTRTNQAEPRISDVIRSVQADEQVDYLVELSAPYYSSGALQGAV
jgi:hypothetical protein